MSETMQLHVTRRELRLILKALRMLQNVDEDDDIVALKPEDRLIARNMVSEYTRIASVML